MKPIVMSALTYKWTIDNLKHLFDPSGRDVEYSVESTKFDLASEKQFYLQLVPNKIDQDQIQDNFSIFLWLSKSDREELNVQYRISILDCHGNAKYTRGIVIFKFYFALFYFKTYFSYGLYLKIYSLKKLFLWKKNCLGLELLHTCRPNLDRLKRIYGRWKNYHFVRGMFNQVFVFIKFQNLIKPKYRLN